MCVGPGNARVHDVADDDHASTLDAAEALPQGQRVQKSLGGVLVGTVAGVDHRRTGTVGAGGPLRDLGAAPELGWRTMSASAPTAYRVLAVSRSDSPCPPTIRWHRR